MNILLINHYAGSPEMGMEFRPYYFAKEWVKMGHNVTIVAASYSHLRKINKDMSSDISEEVIDGIKYIWIKTPKYSGNGISRVKNIFSFMYKLHKNAKLLSEKYRPDAVIASSTYPIDNYTVRKIAKLSNAKHVYEVHDLWPLSPMEIGNMSKYHPFIMLMQHGENFAYKYSDIVVSMLPNTKEHMKNHGLDLDKWHYIPNGFVKKDWENPIDIPASLDKVIKKNKENNKFIVGYTGGHAPSNALNTLIDAAKILKNEKDIVFLLVGSGIEKDSLKERAKDLNNIIFYDTIPKLAMPNLLKEMDILCYGTKKSKLYKYGISMNKMIDYMIAGKPIVQYIDTEYDIIQKAGAGITTETDNPEKISEAILRLKSMTNRELEGLGNNGKEYALKNHDYKALSKKFIDILAK